MSTRTILSRPRTRLYDCNYNIGQSYYKPMVDHLDRKYSGRPTEMPSAYPATRQANAEEQDLFRTRRAGSALDFSEDVEVGRKPLGAAGSALRDFDDIFDNRPSARGAAERERGGLRASSLLANGGGGSNGYDIDDALEEVTANMKRLRAGRAQRLADEAEEEAESIGSRRRHQVALKLERDSSLADRALETVGLRKLDDCSSDSTSSTLIKKRVLRITQDVEQAATSPDLTRWTKVAQGSPLALESASEAAAINRARQTRNRLQDLESEMEEMAERSAVRERRAAQLRSLVAENSERTSEEESSSLRIKSSREKKTVTF